MENAYDILNVSPQSHHVEPRDPKYAQATQMCEKFWPPHKQYENLMHRMNGEMVKGLTTPNELSNDLQMINTYVTNLPMGNESGSYLALDLGGTNYRLLLVKFAAPLTPPTIEEEVYVISRALQIGTANGDLKVTCRALVNDTVGCLASCAFLDPESAIGLIVGTGTNAAYVEKLSKATKITDLPSNAQSVVINTEWGAFGEHGCLLDFLTEFDHIVDSQSMNPGRQTFEKLISGMYLGEIVRHILAKMAREGIIFEGNVPERLTMKDGFPTYYLSEVDRDPTHLFYSTEYILREAFQMTRFTAEDLKIVRFVCGSVANRAATFVAAGLACILNRIDRPRTTIAVDGSLFKFHPTFARTMIEVITKLVPPRCSFRLKLSEDGSGKGAGALVAAVKRAVTSD